MSKLKPIRLGLVGIGRAGWGMHCTELESLKDYFQIVAACDVDPERTGRMAERYGCRSAASGIQWACAASDAELDALDCVRGVITPIHVLAGGRSRTKTDNG